VKKIQKDKGLNLLEYQGDADKERKQTSQRKLREKCQQAKHKLSDVEEVKMIIESLYKDINCKFIVTRKEFEDLNQNLFETTRKCIKEALDGAELSYDDIEDIVLVGGSTKIPKIQQMVRDSFKNSQIIKTINVDEAVATGACIEASKIAKITPENFRVTEVTPFSLGTSIQNEHLFSKIIDRYSAIPVSKTETYWTMYDNQTAALVDVYEGENDFCKDNHFLGEFTITDIPPLPAGEAKIDVTFAIDANGILKVTAVDKQTDNQKSIHINYGKGRLAGIETHN
jgi:molecular chaperone DnaK (HSP70)